MKRALRRVTVIAVCFALIWWWFVRRPWAPPSGERSPGTTTGYVEPQPIETVLLASIFGLHSEQGHTVQDRLQPHHANEAHSNNEHTVNECVSDGLYLIGENMLVFIADVTILVTPNDVKVAVQPPEEPHDADACRAGLRRALQECDDEHQRCLCLCIGPDCMGPPREGCAGACDAVREWCVANAWVEFYECPEWH
jgi:hypothetical protein